MTEGEWAVLRWTLIVLSIAAACIVVATIGLAIEVLS